MLTYRIARSMLAHKPPVLRLRPTQLHALGGLVQPITRTSTFQPPRFQEYSTDRNGTENASGVASAMQGLTNRVTKLEKSSGTAMDDRFNELAKSLRVSLERSFDKSLEQSLKQSLRPIKDEIEDTRAWMKWLVGMVVIWFVSEFAFYDLHGLKRFADRLDATKEKFTNRLDATEGKFANRLDAMKDSFTTRLDVMEARLTTMIERAIT